MRKINRALLTGAAVLPLTFGAAGVAAAESNADVSATTSANADVSVQARGYDHYDHYEDDDDGILGGLLGDVFGNDDFGNDDFGNDDFGNDDFGNDGLGLGVLG